MKSLRANYKRDSDELQKYHEEQHDDIKMGMRNEVMERREGAENHTSDLMQGIHCSYGDQRRESGRRTDLAGGAVVAGHTKAS